MHFTTSSFQMWIRVKGVLSCVPCAPIWYSFDRRNSVSEDKANMNKYKNTNYFKKYETIMIIICRIWMCLNWWRNCISSSWVYAPNTKTGIFQYLACNIYVQVHIYNFQQLPLLKKQLILRQYVIFTNIRCSVKNDSHIARIVLYKNKSCRKLKNVGEKLHVRSLPMG